MQRGLVDVCLSACLRVQSWLSNVVVNPVGLSDECNSWAPRTCARISVKPLLLSFLSFMFAQQKPSMHLCVCVCMSGGRDSVTDQLMCHRSVAR